MSLLEVLLRLLLAISLALPFLASARHSRSPWRARLWRLGLLLAFAVGLLADPLALARQRVDQVLLGAVCGY